MGKDYSTTERREDLPSRSYTIDPAGRLHPLFYGRGIGGVVEARVERVGPGAPAVLNLKIILDKPDPVPWDVLKRFVPAEIEAIKARGGVVLTWNDGTKTVLD